jgi:hypothetical protein
MLASLLLATNLATLTPAQTAQLADCIYRAEGGAHTRYRYGILSVRTSQPRKVCINTIEHCFVRWRNSGGFIRNPSGVAFLTELSNHYCPPSTDPIGHTRWLRNVKWMLGHSERIKPAK